MITLRSSFLVRLLPRRSHGRCTASLALGRAVPNGGYMSGSVAQDIEDAHKLACDAGLDRYRDPTTGYGVFTAAAHLKRGFCCGNGCRHCPYGHFNMPEKHRTPPVMETSVLLKAKRSRKSRALDPNGPLVVLFWSGGKDSFLTLRALQREQATAAAPPHPAATGGDGGTAAAGLPLGGGSLGAHGAEILLLTTFDAVTGTVAFQNTNITDVMAQARHERLSLLAIPLVGGEASTPQGPYVRAVLDALEPHRERVRCLAFGDLHLADIRKWREDTFSRSYPCRFPVFGTPYPELVRELLAEAEPEPEEGPPVGGASGAGRGARVGVSIRVTAVRDDLRGEALREGLAFDRALVAGLPAGVDKMGENGEFHTHVYFNDGGSEGEESDSDDDSLSEVQEAAA